jgi:hypothetical protein
MYSIIMINRTIVGGNQYNVTSSGSGNVSVCNVTNNQQAGGGGSSKRFLSNKVGSPSKRRHKHEDNTNYSTHYSNNNRLHSKEVTEAQEMLAAAKKRLEDINSRIVIMEIYMEMM